MKLILIIIFFNQMSFQHVSHKVKMFTFLVCARSLKSNVIATYGQWWHYLDSPALTILGAWFCAKLYTRCSVDITLYYPSSSLQGQ